MKLKMICCEVFMRMAFMHAAASPHTIDIDFIPVRAHEDSDNLRAEITARIKATDAQPGKYDAIILGYGLCGNSLSGLKAGTVPLILPRAHDCCAVFLGSRLRFRDEFGDKLSAKWSSHGYLERCGDYLRETDTGKLLGMDQSYAELVEKYGEENAAYIWETIHTPFDKTDVIYIRVPEMEHLGFEKQFADAAAEAGESVITMEGSSRLIAGLVRGDWDDEEYLTVPPGMTICPTYDLDRIFEAK